MHYVFKCILPFSYNEKNIRTQKNTDIRNLTRAS